MNVKRKLIAAAAGAGIAPLIVLGMPAVSASAHGYISSPPSRQALCAQNKVPDCGAIKWEPQSVEGPKGLRSCSGGNSQFAVLDQENRGWPATSVGSTVNFNWVITARHATSTWEYYLGGTRVALFDDGGKQPGSTVSHSVNLGNASGRQKLLAIWNIADTPNAFYSCVDLQIGGGSTPGTPPSTPPPSTPPTTGTWATGTAYSAGSQVTYNGTGYRCLQSHTALAGWDPGATPALWERS
ncbi:lytic polysaccharide monooxygenase [Amycolatopsis nigrescens]|uniref:lytic polysaccharide monooxygenase n=1 Tax=Amycolatopsis nigrescens TaxID=381445 RepID=UPI00036A82B2|nr:lytic polysaccharide monooxygenase [Amycolatopsis nigrescens]